MAEFQREAPVPTANYVFTVCMEDRRPVADGLSTTGRRPHTCWH